MDDSRILKKDQPDASYAEALRRIQESPLRSLLARQQKEENQEVAA